MDKWEKASLKKKKGKDVDDQEFDDEDVDGTIETKKPKKNIKISSGRTQSIKGKDGKKKKTKSTKKTAKGKK